MINWEDVVTTNPNIPLPYYKELLRQYCRDRVEEGANSIEIKSLRTVVFLEIRYPGGHVRKVQYRWEFEEWRE